MLASEGAQFTGGRADPERRIAPIQLPYIASLSFDHPTIEYVKEPIELTTGKQSGQRIRMRHFSDCTHWHREADNPGQLIGEPPRRATDEEMRTVPACGSCVTRARKHHNPVRGRRLMPRPEVREANNSQGPTAIETTARRRAEQILLRSRLLAGARRAPCAICGRMLPNGLLVAAHIRNRNVLSEAERYDFTSVAMLACVLGCDALFERGMIVVDPTGTVVANATEVGDDLEAVLDSLDGRIYTAWNTSTAWNFEWHRRLNADPPRPPECERLGTDPYRGPRLEEVRGGVHVDAGRGALWRALLDDPDSRWAHRLQHARDAPATPRSGRSGACVPPLQPCV